MKEFKICFYYLLFILSVFSSYSIYLSLVHTDQTVLTDEPRNCFVLDIISKGYWDGVSSDGSPVGGSFNSVIGVYKSDLNIISVGKFDASEDVELYKFNKIKVPKKSSLSTFYLFIVYGIYYCMYLVLINCLVRKSVNFKDYHLICKKLIENNEENSDNTIDKNVN